MWPTDKLPVTGPPTSQGVKTSSAVYGNGVKYYHLNDGRDRYTRSPLWPSLRRRAQSTMGSAQLRFPIAMRRFGFVKNRINACRRKTVCTYFVLWIMFSHSLYSRIACHAPESLLHCMRLQTRTATYCFVILKSFEMFMSTA